jgi:hypothetical protein
MMGMEQWWNDNLLEKAEETWRETGSSAISPTKNLT